LSEVFFVGSILPLAVKKGMSKRERERERERELIFGVANNKYNEL